MKIQHVQPCIIFLLYFRPMKNPLYFIFIIVFIYACNGNDEKPVVPESDLDAARMFIRSALDGRYDEARKLMIADSTNENRMNDTERTYEHMTIEDKRNYRESSINIHDIRKMDDSTTVVVYSNSFKKVRDSVKVVRWNARWLVDLKYTFQRTLPE